VIQERKGVFPCI